MDRKAIETLSVNAVRDSVVVSDFLDQFIADNDKEPTWDGFVYIYSDKSKKKEKLKGRLPVQIKGTENDDFSKEEISFPVSTKGSAIPQPIEAIPQKLTTQEVRNAQVSVGDRLFYSTVRVVQDAETVTTIFGESFSIKASKNDRMVKINYKSSDKLRTLIVDLDFLISYIETGSFQWDGLEHKDLKG